MTPKALLDEILRLPVEERLHCATTGSRLAATSLRPLLGMTPNDRGEAHAHPSPMGGSWSSRSRFRGRVTMASAPSAVRGHSSAGRSRYSSTPLPSGSRR